MNNTAIGICCILSAALLYALTVNIIPFAQAVGGSAMFYLAIRGIFNFFGSFALSANTGGLPFLCKSNPWLLILLSICVAIQGFGYVQALHLIPISIATPLFFLFPMMTYVLQKILRLQAIKFLPIIMLCISSFGVWLLTQDGKDIGDTLYSGILWALLASLAQAVVNIILTRSQQLSAWQQLRASYLIPLVVFAGYFFFTQDIPSAQAIAWTALSASIFLVGTLLFLQAVRLLGAIRASNLMYLEPVLSVIFSILLHEGGVSSLKIIAIVLILGATYGLEEYERRIRVQYKAEHDQSKNAQSNAKE